MTLEMVLIRRVVSLFAFALGTCACVTRIEAAPTPSPALLISIREAGKHALQIADPRTEKVVATVPITGGGFPHEVGVSPSGRVAYVTSTSYGEASPNENPEGIPGDFISVIDLQSQRELRHIEIGPNSWPYGLAMAGGKVYFTAEGYKLVGRYNPEVNQIDWMLGTGAIRTHFLVTNKDGSKLYTSNSGSNDVTAMESFIPPPAKAIATPFDRWKVTNIPVGKGPEGSAISPDEKEVWVLTRFDGGLSIIDTSTNKVSQTIALPIKTPHRIRFTPDGKRVVIADSDSGDVLIFDAATRKVIKGIRLDENPTAAQTAEIERGAKFPALKTHGVLVSPDGSHAYITVTGKSEVVVIDMNKLEVSGHIDLSGQPETMGWAEAK